MELNDYFAEVAADYPEEVKFVTEQISGYSDKQLDSLCNYLDDNYDNGAPKKKDGIVEKEELAIYIVDMCTEDGGISVLGELYNGKNIDRFKKVVGESIKEWSI